MSTQADRCAGSGVRGYPEGMEQDTTPTRRLNAAERFADLVGIPRPAPMTAQERADYEAWMSEADARLAESIARRNTTAA